MGTTRQSLKGGRVKSPTPAHRGTLVARPSLPSELIAITVGLVLMTGGVVVVYVDGATS